MCLKLAAGVAEKPLQQLTLRNRCRCGLAAACMLMVRELKDEDGREEVTERKGGTKSHSSARSGDPAEQPLRVVSLRTGLAAQELTTSPSSRSLA